MKYCIAIDGGGSKTDAVLFDENGHILYRKVGKGGNATDMGVAEAQRRMWETLDNVFKNAPGPISALYGGIAGVDPNGDIYSDGIKERYESESVRIEDDGFMLLSGTVGHADGGAMVCGTGSSLFVRKNGIEAAHIGGKGYLIDTGGSGFEIGQQAIRMAMRSLDGRIGPTVLTELLREHIGHELDCTVVPIVHKGGRPYIAGFAPLVFQGRKMGDAVCMEIFEQQSSLMADLTHAAAKHFDDDFPVVIGGGIAAHFPEYVEAIKAKAHPRAHVMLQSAPPVYGAAVEAMWDAGIAVNDEVKTNFISDYARLSGDAIYM